MEEKQVIAVWFSCGAASAVAAKKTIGKFYEIIYSMISRFALLYNPKKFILSSYQYHLTD